MACIQVGGDGLFQEVLNGILSIRGAGGKAGQVAAHLRLGHIPAGSTDAVAFSLNGTRSQATAALHIALGDRRALSLLLTPSNPSNYNFPLISIRIFRLVHFCNTSDRRLLVLILLSPSIIPESKFII